MNVTVWYSSESMADYIIDHTVLRNHRCSKRRLQESDASKPAEFHAVPDHIKKILYLDAPDIIVEVGSNPIFTIEENKASDTRSDYEKIRKLRAAGFDRALYETYSTRTFNRVVYGVAFSGPFRYADLAASYGLDVVVQIAEDETCSIVHGDI